MNTTILRKFVFLPLGLSLVLSVQTGSAMYCNNQSYDYIDPTGGNPIPLDNSIRQVVEDNDDAATTILQQLGGPETRVWTPDDILGKELKTSNFGLTNPGLSIPLYWTSIPLDSKAQMRARYPDIVDPDVALLEATRRNTVGAQMALVSRGLLPETQRQRLLLRTYTGMLDLTAIAATVPFQVPSVATIPFVRTTLGTPLANPGILSGSVRTSIAPTEDAQLSAGTFSVIDWSGYPSFLPRPTGPMRLLNGPEYLAVRKSADATNNILREGFDLRGLGVDIHEILPVKFGGSPIDPLNKMILPTSLHRQTVTPFWNQLQRNIAPFVVPNTAVQ